jgi:hypothetical protein
VESRSTPPDRTPYFDWFGVTMFGLRTNLYLHWKPYATDGMTTVSGTTKHLLTAPDSSLPADLQDLVVTTWTAEGQDHSVENVVLNYACDNSQPKTDYLLIFDDEGRLRWYQDPRGDIGLTTSDVAQITGLSRSRQDNNLLVIVNHDYLLEYDLNGNLEELYCRNVGGSSPECPSGVHGSGYFNDYVHHDVIKAAGATWALTAKQRDVADPENMCGDTDGTSPIIVDGVLAMDDSTGIQVVDWDLDSIYDVVYDPDQGNCGTVGDADCAGAYWTNDFGAEAGCDWSHANSLWVDAEDQWMMSLKNQDWVISVDASGASPILDWTLDGHQLVGDYDMSDPYGYGEKFTEQHAAMWGEDFETLYIFDNEQNTPGSAPAAWDSRAVGIDFGPGAMIDGTPDLVYEWTMEDEAGDPVNCLTGGSTVELPEDGHQFAFCAQHDKDNQYPVMNEFWANNSIAWGMAVQCDGVARGPSYRGYPIAF